MVLLPESTAKDRNFRELMKSLRELYDMLFSKNWPVWVGGILLGMLNVCLFMVYKPWGGSGGFNNWGENLYKLFGIPGMKEATPVNQSYYGMLCVLVVLGSFVGALLSKEFAIRIPPKGELIKGFIGGALMAIGATMGLGCSIGGFFSGIPALSAGALLLTLGLLVGTIVALRYLLWEMEAFPQFSSGKSRTLLPGTAERSSWQRWLGLVIIIAVLVMAYQYNSGGNEIMSWFVIIGLLLGLICQRSRFCIVRAFREPFMTGESTAVTGVIAGLLVGIFGFAIIKSLGVGAVDAGAVRTREMMWVFSHFWLRAPIGGFIFGLGMTVAGGCAVGTLWRVGEGQVKLWAAALGFLLISPISKRLIVPAFVRLLPHSMRYKYFLPDELGYAGAIALILCILLLWYMFAKWNERTGKFSAL